MQLFTRMEQGNEAHLHNDHVASGAAAVPHLLHCTSVCVRPSLGLAGTPALTQELGRHSGSKYAPGTPQLVLMTLQVPAGFLEVAASHGGGNWEGRCHSVGFCGETKGPTRSLEGRMIAFASDRIQPVRRADGSRDFWVYRKKSSAPADAIRSAAVVRHVRLFASRNPEEKTTF